MAEHDHAHFQNGEVPEEEVSFEEQVDILLTQIEEANQKDCGIIEETERQTEEIRKQVERLRAQLNAANKE